jgi:ABC-2 type transport system permease protein
MKFWEIFRFEVTYQLRRAWPWLIIVMLMLLVFLFVRDGSFAEALYTEFFINSPFMVAMATVFGSLLWLLTAAFITGEAAARDIASGMHPLTYSVPVTKIQYVGGKFLAAFIINAFILLSVQGTIMLAVYLPGVHPDSIGAFRPAAFLTAYTFIALPNAFAATAIQFAVSLKSGRPIAAYLGSLFLFFTSFFIASLILFRSGLGTLLDPIGVRFIWDELSHLWTTVEKSYRLLELKGPLLQNRLVWIGTGVVVTAFTYVTFRFTHRTVEFSWWTRFIPFQKSKRKLEEPQEIRKWQDPVIPNSTWSDRTFGFTFHFRQVLAIAWTSFRSLATSWAGLAMLIFIPLLAIPVVIDQMVAMSVPLVPTTARVIKELTGPLSADMSRWMVIPGFIIFFAGELAWRERDNNIGEITDAMPGSEWAPVLGKLLGLNLMLIAFTVALTVAGMIAQLLMGYSNFEFALYLQMMFGLQLPEYMLFAVLAILVHSLANQKYVGHLVAIIAYAFIAAIATMLGIEHNLWIYEAGPQWYYTEMRGFGTSLGPWAWSKLYWASWALLFTVVATLFWARGKESGFGFRLQLARRRLTLHTAWVAIAAILSILLIGGYIFYNTNVLNKYRDSTSVGEWRAEYERRYGKFENNPMPRHTAANLHVEIYPERRSLSIEGTYRLVNASAFALDSIHISTPTGGAITTSLTFDRDASVALNDSLHAYRIYVLQAPLKPGDSLYLNFKIDVTPRGFTNRGIDPSLDEHGSFFTNQGWVPSIGFQRQRGLTNPADRKTHGLEPRALMASLYEAHEGDAPSLDAGIAFEAIIGTADNQVAVAPGTLQRTWQENGRSYFHYSTSKPIGSDWVVFSADYKVHEAKWFPSGTPASQGESSTAEPVIVKIYYHPTHTAHLEPMMRGALASLEYYSKQFGAYPYSHLTLAEHPYAPGTGMHAEPSMIYYGQGYPYWIAKNESQLDFPYAVMGHEVAHQWTLPYALAEGLPFLSEGIAWYYGIMLVKETRGEEQTRQLLSFLRRPYPHQPIRRGEPLLRALDPYLSYRRGPFAMYALTEYVGTEKVNSAIRKLVEKSEMVGAEPVTTLDLYNELQAVTPDSMKYLLHDLFEVNTLWEFETKSVKAVETKEGTWQVTLDVKARKFIYDSAGVETDMQMDELIAVGVFAAASVGHDELSTPLYMANHRIRSGDQTITLTVNGKPVLAGIDPHHLLDWEEKEDDDNIEEVSVNPK